MIEKILKRVRLKCQGKILVACANGRCLHTLDGFGEPAYVEVDEDYKSNGGDVYCSVDCMQYFSNRKMMSA